MMSNNIDIIQADLNRIGSSSRISLLNNSVKTKIDYNVDAYLEKLTKIYDYIKSCEFVLDSTTIVKILKKEDIENVD